MVFTKKVLPPGTYINPEFIIDEETLKTILIQPKTKIIDEKERKGKYIVIEGIDGSGKTTIAGKLRIELEKIGKKTEVVREPWTSEIKALLTEYPNMNPLAEAYLFAADRLLLHTQKIANLLRIPGMHVIGDRSYIASIVYQSVRGAEEEAVISINAFAIKPDVVFLLDVDPQIAWKRINNKAKKQLQHLEQKYFLDKLRNKYLELAKKIREPEIIPIDAEKKPDVITQEIISGMKRLGLL